jgi:hypothetical protein
MATRWDRVPKLDDDVVKSSMEDARKVVKDTSKLRGAAVDAVKEAGSRAASRLLGRAGAAGAALQGGYELGKYIDEKTGAGKKLVDKSGLGDMAEKMATPSEKVELTDESKARIARGDLDEKPKAKAPAYKDSEGGGGGRSEPRDTTLMENREPKEDNMKRGGRVHASKRADGIAQRGHTRYRGDKK